MIRKTAKPAAPVAAPEAVNHRADAVQAFMSAWLPQHGVSATVFKAADAEALLAAVDAGAAAAGK